MKKTADILLCVLEIIGGCALYALGFDLFLEPNGFNAGGLSGLCMILVYLTKHGSVGTLSLLISIPLFLISWRSIGRKFFLGSLLGTVSLSFWLELFELLPAVETEPILAALYGGILTGVGSGLTFLAGASSGGSDIIIRMVKKRCRNIPIGQIVLAFDGSIMLMTGIVFHDYSKILYCIIALYTSSKLVDSVVYSFDFSKVAMIVSRKPDEIAESISRHLHRGSTFLYGQKHYTGEDTRIVMTAIKRYQVNELKRLIMHEDPGAFVIFQDSHQVLGDGFVRYSEDQL
ncbi:MAG: YitT family protein [Lachnospiraceae bacterium]|nr:YitT family protein [Lachnospiraceae bacterium]